MKIEIGLYFRLFFFFYECFVRGSRCRRYKIKCQTYVWYPKKNSDWACRTQFKKARWRCFHSPSVALALAVGDVDSRERRSKQGKVDSQKEKEYKQEKVTDAAAGGPRGEWRPGCRVSQNGNSTAPHAARSTTLWSPRIPTSLSLSDILPIQKMEYSYLLHNWMD